MIVAEPARDVARLEWRIRGSALSEMFLVMIQIPKKSFLFKLVGGLEHVLFFHILGIIIPNHQPASCCCFFLIWFWDVLVVAVFFDIVLRWIVDFSWLNLRWFSICMDSISMFVDYLRLRACQILDEPPCLLSLLKSPMFTEKSPWLATEKLPFQCGLRYAQSS